MHYFLNLSIFHKCQFYFAIIYVQQFLFLFSHDLICPDQVVFINENVAYVHSSPCLLDQLLMVVLNTLLPLKLLLLSF